MPSLVISDSPDTTTQEEIKSKKEKKMKKIKSQGDATDVESPETDKKSSKKSKKSKSSDCEEVSDFDSSKKSKKKEKKEKKEKKRKAVELDDSDRSETSAELGEPVNSVSNKKAKVVPADSEVEEEEEEEEEANPNAVSNFKISEPLREKLKSRGIKSLFPIQAMTFNMVLEGCDLVGRARTGQGKTLAFVLPILESLVNGRTKSLRKTGYGKPPSVLVLLPTRELAKQVYEDFQIYGGAVGLTSCCVYGGAPYRDQQVQLKRGVDVIVGSPGRVKDHIERGNINLGSLQFRVLDEADEMLRMGFVEDVELILSKVDDVSKVQTVLFSATLPDWVRQIASRFLKPDKKTVDLVSDQKMKASTSVRHIVMPCSVSARPQLIPDIIQCYASGGRTIIFTETKDSASQLAGLLPGARALHGDIQQATREVTLSGFRSGKFSTLVATNVAARGLDINDVQLIIQCEPPRDVEAYIHRSGRTGRAGNTGIAVMLYDPRKGSVNRIERESGVKFEHLTAPQPADVAKAAGIEAIESISQVSDSVIPVFKSAAEDLLKNSGLSAIEILSKALAKAAGYTDIKKRSLLSSMENYATLHLECGRPIYTPTLAFNCLRRYLPDNKVEAVKEMTVTADGKGAVFDVPADDIKSYLTGTEGISVEVVKTMPRLQVREPMSRGRFGNSSGGSRFGRGGGGGFRGGRGGGGFRGGRGGRGRW